MTKKALLYGTPLLVDLAEDFDEHDDKWQKNYCEGLFNLHKSEFKFDVFIKAKDEADL